MSKNTYFRSIESSILPANLDSTTSAIKPQLGTRNLAGLIGALLLCLLPGYATGQQAGSIGEGISVSSSTAAANYGGLPLAFEINSGQTDPQVRFLSRGNGYSLFLTDSAAVLALTKSQGAFASKQPVSIMKAAASPRKTDVVRMELAGASKGSRATGDGQLPGKANYFIGKDPAKWRTDVPTYSKVRYAEVYPGVDLVYYGNQGRLEYDFIVAPFADPKPIRLRFSGANKLKLDNDGNLRVAARDGEIAFHKPVVYQEIDGQRRAIEGQFKLVAGNTVNFTLGSYRRDKAVVIDPTLVYSTYLGGSVDDFPYGIAVDLNGDAYIAGFTLSSDFPVTPGAFQMAANSQVQAFITKLNPAGTALLYSTYLGGSGNNDAGFAVTVDGNGDALITGGTTSSDFPVTYRAFQTALNGTANAFVTKLNPSGSALIYSTFLGGSGIDFANAIKVNSAGDAYLAGKTESSDFPVTSGAFQTINNGTAKGNAFVTRLNAAGSALVYSTYLGGTAANGPDYGNAIAVDSAGDAFITGTAYSADFPVTNGALQTTNLAAPYGTSNAFISKIDPTGTALLYSTYLGGSGGLAGYPQGDIGYGIAVDKTGNTYVGGTAYSTDFPVSSSAFQTHSAVAGAPNGFVTELSPSGSSVVFSTYLGGSQGASVRAIALDASGHAYVAGGTFSSDFPVTSDAFQTNARSANAFVTKFNSIGTGLVYSTYLGGTSFDEAYGIATDTIGDTYVAGQAGSINFPVTSGAFQTTKLGSSYSATGFVSKFGLAPLDFSQPGINFGNVLVGTRTHGVAITATNYTNAPARYLSGSNLSQFHISGGTCGRVSEGMMLAAGASCTFEVWFAPTQAGPVTGSFTINTVSGPVTFIVTGTGSRPQRK